ncbi:MAG: hypothetical protein IKZ56_02425 [Bacteroidales bacterium]|nr:hypothetical protein [Bacteroidales bacterium]MBR5920004.1 hypothetical protein [Bacteroidales bacterium]
MKKTITLLFFVLSTSIASAQDTLTAAQMREDFNYILTLTAIFFHPCNPL